MIVVNVDVTVRLIVKMKDDADLEDVLNNHMTYAFDSTTDHAKIEYCELTDYQTRSIDHEK